MSYTEDTDVHLEQQDYTNVEEYYEDEDDDFSFDVRDTVNPLLTVAAPRGEEYIFDDDFSRKKLSWGDRFSWLIGGGFITGSLAGGVWGFAEGVRGGRGKARKLMINSITRAMTNRGGRLGNGGAMLALLYSGIEGLAGSARRQEDSMNILVASTLCPIIYFSSAGARAVLGGVGGLVLGLGICAWRKYDTTGLKHLFG